MTTPAETTTETTSTETTVTAPPAWTPPQSQEELDRIIAGRVERTKAQFKNYEDYKAKAAKFEELEAASKSDLQKAQEAAEVASKRAAELEAKTKAATLKAALVEEGAKRGVVKHNLLAKQLDADAVTVDDDGTVTGLGEWLDAFLTENPEFVGKPSTVKAPGSVGAGNTQPPGTGSLADRIAEAEAAGDWGLAGSLKTQQLLAAKA